MAFYTIVAVLVIVACVLLILIVLVQNSKGGGLASNFSSSNQVMGVRKTTDFLEKGTWTLAIIVLVLSVGSSIAIPRSVSEEGPKSVIQEQIDNATDPTQLPTSFPTAPPPAAAPEGQPTE